MRGTLKTSTLESKFPLLRVENNCIISKFADITAAYRVSLPELFTLTGEEYEALHGAWLKALKVLPDYTVVHKQDFFIEERYETPNDGSERSFLARSYERHFNERPYLRHTCYLFVTKTTPERMRQTSASSVLCRGFIVPREMRDTDAVTRFLEAAEQMERILNDSGLVRVERLTEAEIVGTADDAGLLARYFALSDEQRPVVNEDIRLDPGTMRIGDKYLSMHTLSDLDMLPQSVATDFRYERLSTDRSDCRLSFAAPVGLLLSCNHVYNQVIFLDDHDETLKRLEASARNMNSLAAYSRSNAINREWIEMYLNEAHSGAQANMAVFMAVLNPGDKFLGLNLSHGGHLSHGSPVNFSGLMFHPLEYSVKEDTGYVDYDMMEEVALRERPKLIIGGASAYSREWDYARMRKIADEIGAIFMVDMAHPAGLIAAGLLDNPLKYAHIVTSTTHKTLRGPRGGIILMGKDFENPWGKKTPKGEIKCNYNPIGVTLSGGEQEASHVQGQAPCQKRQHALLRIHG